MEKTDIIRLLEMYKSGKINQEDITEQLLSRGVESLGFAAIDTERNERTGIPEVIYAAGKTADQVAEIAERMVVRGIPVLATRAGREVYDAVHMKIPDAIYHEQAKAIVYQPEKPVPTESYIAVVTAGTSDIPVSEEAGITAEFLGNRVERIYDVGVAGLHRLFGEMDKLKGAKVLITVAGMEGALPSIVGGLVDKPIIAVPTSIGYGASFNGLAALLGMLTSCAAGVSVVNIDNGFGAGYMASMINHL